MDKNYYYDAEFYFKRQVETKKMIDQLLEAIGRKVGLLPEESEEESTTATELVKRNRFEISKEIEYERNHRYEQTPKKEIPKKISL